MSASWPESSLASESAAKGAERITPAEAAPQPAGVRRSLGLAERVLLLTIGFVFITITAYYVTRLANFREAWLRDWFVTAHTAAATFGGTSSDELPEGLARHILGSVDAQSIVIYMPGRRRVLSQPGPPPKVSETYDVDNPPGFAGVLAAIRTLFEGPDRIIKIVGSDPLDNARIEITLSQRPLYDAMWRVALNYVTLLLIVASVWTLALWAALWQMVIRPVRRLTSNIIAFGEKPQEGQVIVPSGRNNEIGRAETALAAMQASLASELGQSKRLAELGMAVARINHDLRNMLSAAQLISDRLAAIPDPLAQRLAPRLVATLDRAIQFCQSTLTYGAASEQAPLRRAFDLREVVRQIVETAEAAGAGTIRYAIDIPPKFELLADPDHVQRIIENLSRNAAQALQFQGACRERPAAIRFAAIRTSAGLALIEVSDTGPGFTPEQMPHIFEPFHISSREGGSGLGLAIAADLVARNGGSITLATSQRDDFYCGARFLIALPTPQDARKP
jgi:signal transduction histidine kinase